MTKFSLSKDVFEKLVKHLVEMEEGKNKLIDQYYPKLSKERNEFKKFIEDYIKLIDQLIRNIEKSQFNTADNRIPFVILGSEVEVQDLTDGKVFKYRMANPFCDSIKGEDVSCLSPVGKSLLLKKVGDEVGVKAPGGAFYYKIESIWL